MFSDWREWWGNPELAVGIVQLASFMPVKTEPADDPWPQLRESQRQYTLRDPHSGLAVAIDAGEADDIHPYDKHVIGRRLARWALAKVYGKNIPAGGPIPQKADFGAQVSITFDQPGSGLRVLNGSPLGGFTLAGADGVFHPAVARIEGKNRVIVSSPAVTAPRHVRYAWQNNPVDANLVSQQRLPAVPFELRAQPAN
jgi:sialate O-acetylesterase